MKDKINSTGCELISKEYKNNTTPLKVRCKCGNIFETTYQNIQKGTHQCKLKVGYAEEGNVSSAFPITIEVK